MTQVQIRLNGRTLSADVEPRQHLADFLREDTLLTGTHLGCEHGVCGACTVLIDGAPARSCIAFPVALDGTSVTTIEGLAEDAVMVRLREAFSAEHALQCGFCTPGMLIMGRDIVLRRPGADAETIRHELAGNLCRCTGYIGIVRAIEQVAGERRGEIAAVTRGSVVEAAEELSPLHLPALPAGRISSSPPKRIEAAAAPADEFLVEPLRNPVELVQRFEAPAPRDIVWALFQDPARVVACLPGARLTAPSDGRSLRAEMVVKLGPIQAAFGGIAMLAADPARWSGTIDGRGVDQKSATRVQARLVYSLGETPDRNTTAVEVQVAYALQGPLAQMSRSALARSLADRITGRFAENLAIALAGGAPPAESTPLDAGSVVVSMLKGWLRRIFHRP